MVFRRMPIESPQMWVRPQLPFGRYPLPLQLEVPCAFHPHPLPHPLPSHLSLPPSPPRWAKSGQSPIASVQRTQSTLAGHSAVPRGTNSALATRAAIYRSLRALRARNRKKVSKKVFWGVGRKVPKNTRKSLKIPIFGPFWVFLDFFGYFLGLFCRPPERPFLRFFCDFGPGGPGDSCKWRLASQYYTNERQSRDSNRNATNAGSTRT